MEFKRKCFPDQTDHGAGLADDLHVVQPWGRRCNGEVSRSYLRGWLRCRRERLQQGQWHSCDPWGTWWGNVISSVWLTPKTAHFHFFGQRTSLATYSTEKKAIARLWDRQTLWDNMSKYEQIWANVRKTNNMSKYDSCMLLQKKLTCQKLESTSSASIS